MAVPIADFEDESGFHTPENISVDADDAWGEEAQRLLRQHRLSCDLEAVRRDQKPQRRFKRPFETLETAFQVTCQVMVALLSPRVHPWMRRLSACLRMQRTYPEVLPSPSLSVFVSGFHAKLVLDVANGLSLPPFRWVQYRPEPEEMLSPLTIHGMELNLLGALAGVFIGRVAVETRQVLHGLGALLVSMLPVPPLSMDRAVPFAAPCAALCFHISSCAVLSPYVVTSLAALLQEAQLHGAWLVPTLAQSLRRNCRGWVNRFTSDSQANVAEDDDVELVWLAQDSVEVDDHVPPDLLCPITGQFFVKPSVLQGSVFERKAVERWVASTGRHPVWRGIQCRMDDIQPATDVEALCHRLAESKGWVLVGRS